VDLFVNLVQGLVSRSETCAGRKRREDISSLAILGLSFARESMSEMQEPLVLINAVGLTPRWLPHAPRLRKLAEAGWMRPLRDVLPAVTCTAQATMLTGCKPAQHGIVGNGWLFRDTNEVRFWQQSNALLQAEPVYVTACRHAARQGRSFKAAKLFWWFNQGASVDLALTPKPFYASDGNKAFAIDGRPSALAPAVEQEIGRFPFASFWGPNAGLPATEWIARASASIVRSHRPDLSLVYLPHLDYEPQRRGPTGCDMPRLVKELDDAAAMLLDAAAEIGARVWVVSEYGHCDVSRVVEPNRALRRAGLLSARPGPFGEVYDPFESRAIAVCDHQFAHVYIRKCEDVQRVRETLEALPGVDYVVGGEARAELGLDHARSGELIMLAKPDAWFAYPFWLDDRRAPDYARTVDIHRKPGYDPCELFFDPRLRWPKLRVVRRLFAKKLGFRTLFDVIPLDANVVRGSHGLVAANAAEGPLLIGHGPQPGGESVSMCALKDLLLHAMGLSE
jgi:predicted AlkP superfamily pyrophosphatase or phosphodiesterase